MQWPELFEWVMQNLNEKLGRGVFSSLYFYFSEDYYLIKVIFR